MGAEPCSSRHQYARVVVALLLAAASRWSTAAADQKAGIETAQGAEPERGNRRTATATSTRRRPAAEAMTVAKDNSLTTHKVMASVYMLYGVLKINEHEGHRRGRDSTSPRRWTSTPR
jgi:hypothetical protein